ncbi:unnamed protein product [Dibothriocephalus latus]|uniref:Uncharacterized protein n=1 Tax=Dibothriocephalus latus TaxID=60516 RepID=A0A3P6R1H9_DIBLA|nr:unnamed protein product [Dibothriocephalus latus]
MVVTFLALTPSKLTIRERIYVVFAWMPKGTVQALISGLVFNELCKNTNAHLIDWGVTHNGIFDFTYVLSQLVRFVKVQNRTTCRYLKAFVVVDVLLFENVSFNCLFVQIENYKVFRSPK